MILEPAPIAGVVVVHTEPIRDERGAFARLFCADTFAAAGLVDHFPQWSLSTNDRRGTLRGMHYSVGPAAETKLVWVARGAIFDALVDLRRDSPTFLRTFTLTLQAGAGQALYIPAGVAHGFQTFADGTEVVYHISSAYVAEAARGGRWNDPAFAIPWPAAEPRIMNARDAGYPDFVS